MQGFLERLNPKTRSLHEPLLDRRRTAAAAYEAMAEEILRPRARGPRRLRGVLRPPRGLRGSRRTTRCARARAEGFRTRMLPAASRPRTVSSPISASTRVAPAARATRRPTSSSTGSRVDPTAALVLWQIGTVGNVTARRGGPPERASCARGDAARAVPARPRGRRLRGVAVPGLRPARPGGGCSASSRRSTSRRCRRSTSRRFRRVRPTSRCWSGSALPSW